MNLSKYVRLILCDIMLVIQLGMMKYFVIIYCLKHRYTII